MNEQSLKNALAGLPVPEVIYYEETDSTNERALNLADRAEEFTLLVADRQTAGRGRMGRRWVTTPDNSLAFTVILRPTSTEHSSMGFFSFLGGLAVCLAIEEVCDAKPQVKWPNDVLLGGKKTAGVLAEFQFQGDQLAGAALGIGVNLLSGSVPPPREVMFPATCVSDHCAGLPERELFLASIMRHLIKWRPRILERAFLEAYQSRLAFVGEKVLLAPLSGNDFQGILLGVDALGYMVLELEDGEVKAFPVGDIKLSLL